MAQEYSPRSGSEDPQRIERFKKTVANYRTQSITAAEHAALIVWLNESDSNQQLFEQWILEVNPGVPPDRAPVISMQKAHARQGHGILLFSLIVLLFLLIILATSFFLK